MLYPLTPVQEGMLFHTLADPEAGHYVEQFVCRLRGELDLAALRESWQRLVRAASGTCGPRSTGPISISLTRSSIVGPSTLWTIRIGES